MTNDLFDSIYTSLPERAKLNLCLYFGFSVRIMEADDRIDRKRIRRIANNRPKRRNPMAWDYAENIFQLLADLLGLLMCLFFYITHKRREWIYGLLFFLCGLLSTYYWTAHLVIMDTWPAGFTLMTYSGWDLAYLFLFLLLRYTQTPEERKFIHPLMLFPLALDAAILAVILFSPSGESELGQLFSSRTGYFLNHIWLVIIVTLTGTVSVQGLCWYRKHRTDGAEKPWIALGGFVTALMSFAMWITAGVDQPSTSLYYPFSFLCSLSYLFLVYCIRRSVGHAEKEELTADDRRFQNTLKAASLGVVLLLSGGGVLLGAWIRDKIVLHIDPDSASGIYDIIPIVLFIISLVLIIFIITMIFVVYSSQRAAENSRLREARLVAERSSAAKSEFLAAMSHEIRTPINAVLGMNEIVLRESRQAHEALPDSSDEIRRLFGDICGYAGIINSAGKNLLSIINDILDISRIESGKMEIREENYTLSSLLNDVCNLVSVRAMARNLSFRVNVDRHLPDSLYGDAVRVRQVMLNVLVNAVKYTEQGSVTLSVYADGKSSFEKDQVMNLVISVQDTGIGIRREDMGKLFAKFERIDPDDSGSASEGSGLGLAITKNLLDMMGGSIRVESRYGEGSVFTVTVPQKVVSPEPVGNFQERFAQSAENMDVPQELFRAPSARILVVDDTRMNLSVVKGLLKRTDMQIDTALGGEAALEQTLSIPYDLILLDQRMPGMDGIETLHRIRLQEGGANLRTPVICLTADAVAGAKKRYLAEGFTDYLSKPIDIQALRRKLLTYLPRQKVTRLSELDEQLRMPDALLSPEKDPGLAKLRTEDIDIAQGLGYCQQDVNLYRAMLAEFAGEAPGKILQLEKSFTAGAWKDYALLVHSLKGTAGTIGAVRLSLAAAAMETAAREEDTAALQDGHAPLIALWRQIGEAVRAFREDADSALPDYSGVIEFLPEEE